MEPKFENRYYSNVALLSEFYRREGLTRMPGWLSIILAVAMVASTVMSLRLGIFLDILPMLIIWLVASLVLGLSPQWLSWVGLRNVKKQNDGRLPEDIITVDDRCIRLEEGTVSVTLEYRKIQRVVRLKHSYVLMNGKHTGVILEPNSFTKGSFSEFKAFLRKKRPDLDIPE